MPARHVLRKVCLDFWAGLRVFALVLPFAVGVVTLCMTPYGLAVFTTAVVLLAIWFIGASVRDR